MFYCFYLTLTKILPGSYYDYPHLTRCRKWGSERLGNTPKITQLINGRVETQTQIFLTSNPMFLTSPLYLLITSLKFLLVNLGVVWWHCLGKQNWQSQLMALPMRREVSVLCYMLNICDTMQNRSPGHTVPVQLILGNVTAIQHQRTGALQSLIQAASTSQTFQCVCWLPITLRMAGSTLDSGGLTNLVAHVSPHPWVGWCLCLGREEPASHKLPLYSSAWGIALSE